MAFGQKVSNDELLIDIATTKAELAAYESLLKGFSGLADLRDQPQVALMRAQAATYRTAAQGCREFLKELNKLKEERGL